MGKARRLKKKRMGEMLLTMFPDTFTMDFQENKRLVSDVMEISSTTLRNRIAGYVTAAMHKQRK
jgi:small subunit ribosomal protein S17e